MAVACHGDSVRLSYFLPSQRLLLAKHRMIAVESSCKRYQSPQPPFQPILCHMIHDGGGDDDGWNHCRQMTACEDTSAFLFAGAQWTTPAAQCSFAIEPINQLRVGLAQGNRIMEVRVRNGRFVDRVQIDGLEVPDFPDGNSTRTFK